jgi:long-chain acyl-CoA synthetase
MNKFSVCELLLRKEKEDANQVYLRQPRDGVWHEYTCQEVVQKARRVRTFLYEKGLKKGDKVAIASKNCAEWFIVDYGIALAGMVSVPLFANQNKDTIEYVLDHAEVKLLFVGKLDAPDVFFEQVPKKYISVNMGYHNFDTTVQWQEVLASEPAIDFELPEPSDLYTIIYSSGTTGQPKGAVFTHSAIANFLACYSKDIREMVEEENYSLVSYLPLAHVFERTQIQLGSLTIAATVSFVESPEKFVENLQNIRPHLFHGVPRIYGVMKEKIEAKLPAALLSVLLHIPGISSIIKKKIKKELGFERVDNFVSGAAHLPLDIFEFFEKLGVLIQEGYGQTENLAYATYNKLWEFKKGSVGSPRIGVKLKLGDENELLCYSDCLMQEYYKRPEATAETFTEDGWLKTGDIAELDSLNRVTISGRLSETFKNQKGEFIQPVGIELAFNKGSFVEQLCLIGQDLPHNMMVVNLSAKGLSTDKGIIKDFLIKALDNINKKLRSYEKISHIIVAPEIWDIENDMMTPTLKIKRRNVYAKYIDTIKASIHSEEKVIWSD